MRAGLHHRTGRNPEPPEPIPVIDLVFWLALGLAVYQMALFPVIVIALSYVVGKPIRRDPAHEPTLTILITAHNEERHIRAKMANTLALDYPPEKTEILVALDGCTDRTRTIVEQEFPDPRVRILDYPERRGKTPVQNDACREASGEIVFLTDATVTHEPDCARKLVSACADPSVGCVSGAVTFSATSGATRHGVSTRLSYEQFVRGRLGILYSMLGATGANYAMRRSCIEEVPRGITHDFAAPVLALMRGYRTVYEPDALCNVARPLGDGDELNRRARLTVHGLNSVLNLPGALDVVHHPVLALVMVSARLLKWFIPVLLLVALGSNLLLLDQPIYRVTLGAQALFYGLAALGGIWRRRGRPPFFLSVPFYFCLLNLAALKGLWQYARGERLVIWSATRR